MGSKGVNFKNLHKNFTVKQGPFLALIVHDFLTCSVISEGFSRIGAILLRQLPEIRRCIQSELPVVVDILRVSSNNHKTV
jgi:hypothetical protein